MFQFQVVPVYLLKDSHIPQRCKAKFSFKGTKHKYYKTNAKSCGAESRKINKDMNRTLVVSKTGLV
jgi:hypothetical protein